MRIAVNARFLSSAHLEGLGQFTLEVCRRLVRDHPDDEFLFFFDRPCEPRFQFPNTVTPLVLFPPTRHPLLTLWWFELALAPALRRHRPDVLLSPDGALPLRADTPGLPVVHDLAFEHFPAHLGALQGWYWRTVVPASARRAARIATVSEFTKRDLIETYGIAGQKIDVTPNGVAEDITPLAENEQRGVRAVYSAGAEYLLHIGAIQPRKNLINLLHAFEQFKLHSNRDTKLLLAGRLAWKYRDLLRTHAGMRFRDDVHFLGYLPRRELARVLGAALGLACVSLYEGFALPVAEAMVCGVPVIGSARGAIPEVAGDAAILVDPLDSQQIAAAFDELVGNAARRAQLTAAGLNRAKRFDWNQTAASIWSALQQAAATSR